MDSSSFIPTPIGVPAHMVLSSTAENQEGVPRITGPPIFSTSDTPNYAIYRPGGHFPAPIFAPGPHLVRSATERSTTRIVHPVTTSAFRAVAGDNPNPDPFHSALSPAKRSKPEDLSIKATNSSETEESNVHYFPKDQRPSSLGSVNYDTNSDTLSELGDREQGTPDLEGRTLRKQRKKLIVDGQVPHCPVCSLTLRPGEVETHVHSELDRLEKLGNRTVRKSREKALPSPNGSRGKESPGIVAVSRTRHQNYLRVQRTRQSRLLGARSRGRKKRQQETACPVCNIKVTGTPEELNEHVELCLKKRGDEDVDVEDDGQYMEYEEYTWAGQTRIRATTMLDGGFAGSGFQVTSCSSAGLDEDCDLNVDDDDSDKYGKPQYSEADVIPCTSDEPAEDRAREALRGAVLSTAEHPSPLANHTRLSDTNIEGAHQLVTDQSDLPGQVKCEPQEDNSEALTGSAGHLISALTFKVKEKDKENNTTKCLICMEPYNNPVTSTQCWHVHCEECWLKTLGAKKLCPQCNMITSPGDLRKIFL